MATLWSLFGNRLAIAPWNTASWFCAHYSLTVPDSALPARIFPMAATPSLTARPGRLSLPLITSLALLAAVALPIRFQSVSAQEAARTGQPITLLSDVQEANSNTGVITARGNVQIFYPAQNMQATAVQAQYYSREGRIVLTGDVFVLQDGNSIQGEVVTYLVDEGRFVALPDQGDQVQSVYLLPSDDEGDTTVTAPAADFNPKPEFKTPISP
ncbi:MAG: LptA/OstA family protein [Synechococcales bacterium]|nr:LptA/OstA family protein [Synechococcales bacterium]